MTRLKIYSKPRGAGDQTSGGRGKLLKSATDLTRTEILVRETLQNSWDARSDGWIPYYGLHVYELDAHRRYVLQNEVFTDLPPSLDILAESLRHPETRLLEIHDRGTVGLGGPYRAGDAPENGESNNFNAFVFDIGTTKSDATSAGTFGFGKTATFEVSHCHAVVYWSVCEVGDGELEHRLIATALHEPYVEGGVRFTGAHWWGDPASDDIIPLVGDEAKRIGEALFGVNFDGEDGEHTGTSILVIDPELRVERDDGESERVQVHSEEQEALFIEDVLRSLGRSAWPKVMPSGGDSPPMFIEVLRDDAEVSAADRIRSAFSRQAACLNAVRRELDQWEGPSAPAADPMVLKTSTVPITLRPRGVLAEKREQMFGRQGRNTAGYLHLALVAKSDDSLGLDVPSNSLCFMRANAELVVFYDTVIDADLGGFEWIGVFKPTPACDRHFAAAEPPTHDAWTPSMADSDVAEYVVRKTLEQVRSKTKKFLEGHRAPSKRSERSVRDVARALGGFVPHRQVEETQSPDRGSRSSRRRRGGPGGPQVTVTASTTSAESEHLIWFRVESPGNEAVRVRLRLSAQTADGRMALESEEFRLEWFGHTASVTPDAAVFSPGADGSVRICVSSPMALDVALNAEVV